MKKRPDQNSTEGAPDSVNSNIKKKFTGTDNPRHLRAIHALQVRPQPREHIDRAVGCSNSPELVAELRRRGLALECERIPDHDRDGLPIRRGVYFLNDADRRKVNAWLRQRGA